MIDHKASLVTQTVKNLPAMQETQVRSLGWEIPSRGKRYPLQYSCLEKSMDRGAVCSCKESDTPE